MKYQLIKPINPNYSIIQQILTNRGIPLNDIQHYLHTTDDDINPPEALGQDKLKAAAKALIQTIKQSEPALVIIDSDADGFTSAAILINYLHDLFPAWVQNKLTYILHEGKQHGLQDHMEYILKNKFSLIICPDSASSDFNEHQILKNKGITVIVLDHHSVLLPYNYSNAIIINNNAIQEDK